MNFLIIKGTPEREDEWRRKRKTKGVGWREQKTKRMREK